MDCIMKTFEELTAREVYEILQIRSAVFVVEQTCVYQDIDGVDLEAWHVFLRDDRGIRAYLRAFWKDETTAQMGRVLTVDRGKGLGMEVLQAGIRTVREEMKAEKIFIEAQTYTIDFYGRVGFRVTGAEFLEDGIPHVPMELEL
ncbi:MAG: GNAT family N-acetyltransferase [Ruminiclostridium sp.]|nr:GNAT family N-acetyltransferase [Ruminiclostridium sp.]